MKKVFYVFLVVFIVLLMGLTIRLNAQVKALTKENETLQERIHFEHVDDLEMIPCSFCGSEARIYDVGTYEKKYFVKCLHCGFQTVGYSTVQKAIDTWNNKNTLQN